GGIGSKCSSETFTRLGTVAAPLHVVTCSKPDRVAVVTGPADDQVSDSRGREEGPVHMSRDGSIAESAHRDDVRGPGRIELDLRPEAMDVDVDQLRLTEVVV